MFDKKVIFRENYDIGPSNGTTAVLQICLDENNILIAIEDVAMLGGKVLIREAPNRARHDKNVQAQPNVIASLERSLKENAEVWGELSKY